MRIFLLSPRIDRFCRRLPTSVRSGLLVKRVAAIARRGDAFCRRLNDGLAAVAVALAILNSAIALQHHLPSVLAFVLPTIDPETGISINNF
jgi:transposase